MKKRCNRKNWPFTGRRASWLRKLCDDFAPLMTVAPKSQVTEILEMMMESSRCLENDCLNCEALRLSIRDLKSKYGAVEAVRENGYMRVDAAAALERNMPLIKRLIGPANKGK